MSDERYVVVTCLSQFRQRYVIPANDLQGMSPDVKLDPKTLVEYANDSVTMEEVKEFSQHWLGETIVDTFIVDEPRILHMFNRDNDYLSSWSDEKKLAWIKDWEEKKDDSWIGQEGSLQAQQDWKKMNESFMQALDKNYVEESNLTSQKMNEDGDDAT